jgi:hypothetical protein
MGNNRSLVQLRCGDRRTARLDAGPDRGHVWAIDQPLRFASAGPAIRTRASCIHMGSFTYFAAIVVMFLVALVLLRGLYNMMKGGSPMTSNKLMQLRILLQAIAIALIMLTLWFTGGGRPPQKTSESQVPALAVANLQLAAADIAVA